MHRVDMPKWVANNSSFLPLEGVWMKLLNLNNLYQLTLFCFCYFASPSLSLSLQRLQSSICHTTLLPHLCPLSSLPKLLSLSLSLPLSLLSSECLPLLTIRFLYLMQRTQSWLSYPSCSNYINYYHCHGPHVCFDAFPLRTTKAPNHYLFLLHLPALIILKTMKIKPKL